MEGRRRLGKRTTGSVRPRVESADEVKCLSRMRQAVDGRKFSTEVSDVTLPRKASARFIGPVPQTDTGS